MPRLEELVEFSNVLGDWGWSDMVEQIEIAGMKEKMGLSKCRVK